jgi:auxin responsive GH3 family protein
MDTNTKIDVGEDDGLLVLPSRRGIDPEDPSFNPDEFLDTVCEQSMSIQREKLREILARNAEVEYLQRHGLAGRTDVESFRKCIPVVSYSDVEEDILKLVNGDEDQLKKPVLTIDPILFFHRRSSTSTSNCN